MAKRHFYAYIPFNRMPNGWHPDAFTSDYNERTGFFDVIPAGRVALMKNKNDLDKVELTKRERDNFIDPMLMPRKELEALFGRTRFRNMVKELVLESEL